MKRIFEAPHYQAVYFSRNDIVTTSTGCCCDSAGDDWISDGEYNTVGCVGKNLPECTCGLDTPINCV